MAQVSVIIPYYNAEQYLSQCLESIFHQTQVEGVEVSLFDDGSQDSSTQIVFNWIPRLLEKEMSVVLGTHGCLKYCFRTSADFASNSLAAFQEHIQQSLIPLGEWKPHGVGFAKNRAVQQSSGTFLCFQDADDWMKPLRIELQLQVCKDNLQAIVGSQFERDPPLSTPRYTSWCNRISQAQLMTQRFRECTVIQPTWFLHRSIYERNHGYCEDGKGCPEDMIFFYDHLRRGGTLVRVDAPLLVYRFHTGMTSLGVPAPNIRKLRIQAFQEAVLSKWTNFMIWGFTKEGKAFFKALSTTNQSKVCAFCDVSAKKIGQRYILPGITGGIPIISYKEIQPPFMTCVKLDLTGGGFEDNLSQHGFTEGKDYYIFS